MYEPYNISTVSPQLHPPPKKKGEKKKDTLYKKSQPKENEGLLVENQKGISINSILLEN